MLIVGVGVGEVVALVEVSVVVVGEMVLMMELLMVVVLVAALASMV